MKATVVVSCYNQEAYISECLDSILNQQTNFEFTVLVSDDCSTDGTQELLNFYQAQYPSKLQVILRAQNIGAAQNYLAAHKAADGDIIFHCDGDDVMLPGKLEKQLQIFEDHNSVNVVFHRAVFFSDDLKYVAETGAPPKGKDNKIFFFTAEDLALWGSITVHSAYAYRKAARNFENVSREFMEWFIAMDLLLPKGKGAYINEILVKYRCNPNGNAYLASRTGRIKSYRIYFRDLLYYYETKPTLRSYLYSNCLVTALAMLKNGCGFANSIPLFLVKKFYHFNPINLYKTLKIRMATAPSKRVR